MKLRAGLLQDALQRCVLLSQNKGVRAMLVQALNDRARQFSNTAVSMLHLHTQ